jgi:prefoldin subunit 5
MALVQRANVVLEVKDDAVERMLSMGYSVIDETGKVIKRSTAKTVDTLATRCAEQEKKIEALEAEVAKLKKELAAVRKKNDKKTNTTDKENSTKK